jgi:SAM-dependent methyltransferase
VALIAVLMIRRPAANPQREIALGLCLAMVAISPLLVDISALQQLGSFAKKLMVVFVLLLIYVVFRTKPLVSASATMTAVTIWALFGVGNLLFIDRSFFGLHMVVARVEYREYSNGTTLHGAQLHSETGERPTPLTYYHPKGLMAQVVNMERATPAKTVGIVGLGTGALSCYSQPGQDWHFYEIDQKVVDIALNPKLFTFMTDCAKDSKIHLGDARIVLQGQDGLTFDTLVIDAYSSDAIPVHLTTVEAIQLYLDRLSEDGVLVFHVSNRFYDLAQPLAGAAKALGLEGRTRHQSFAELKDHLGAMPSAVVVLARSEAALGPVGVDPLWQALPEPQIELWTDDHADLLAALK